MGFRELLRAIAEIKIGPRGLGLRGDGFRTTIWRLVE
jgi:hypothetical protein